MHYKNLISTVSLALLLTACGGSSGGSSSAPPTPTPTPPADTAAPIVSFDPSTLTLDSGSSEASTLSATDNTAVTSGPTVACTNGGTFDTNTNIFTAPAVTAETTSVCTATAQDAAGNEGTATLTATIIPTPPADTAAPIVSFDSLTLTLDSGSSEASTLSATDNTAVTSGPTVTCTNGGTFDTNTNIFTAPAVTAETTSVCTATAQDAAGNEGTATLTVTITPIPPADTAAPIVSFDPSTLTLDSGSSEASTLSATDNTAVTSGPIVACTNDGSFDTATNIFTAPAVTAETISVCTATAQDAAGNQGTATLTVTITPPPTTITLTGIVHKGIVIGAPIRILDAANADEGVPLVSGVTAADGSYSLTIPEGTEVSDLLVVETLLANAEMVCDAANCANAGISLGDVFTIPADGTGPNDIARRLSAAVPTPEIGVTEVNVNSFTHYQILDMFGLALARQAETGGDAIILPEDYAPTRATTAAIFALPDEDFFAIPFVDITAAITTTDSNAVYAALLGGGLLGAALESIDPFQAITIFEGQVVTDNLLGSETANNFEIISLQDIYQNAAFLGNAIDNTSNVFTIAEDAIADRLEEIVVAAADRPISPDGELPSLVTELTFLSDSRDFLANDFSIALSIVNPDNLNYTATVNEGPSSEFFNVLNATPTLLEIGIDNPPAGAIELNVTFDTGLAAPNSDSIVLNVNAPQISIFEDEVEISSSIGGNVNLTIDNPETAEVTGVSISGEGSEFFLVEGVTETFFTLLINEDNPAPNDTYELVFDITSLTAAASTTDIVSVTVVP